MTQEEVIVYRLKTLENAEVRYNPETEACVVVLQVSDGETREQPAMDVLVALAQDVRYLLARKQGLEKGFHVQSLQSGVLACNQRALLNAAQVIMTPEQWEAFAEALLT